MNFVKGWVQFWRWSLGYPRQSQFKPKTQRSQRAFAIQRPVEQQELDKNLFYNQNDRIGQIGQW